MSPIPAACLAGLPSWWGPPRQRRPGDPGRPAAWPPPPLSRGLAVPRAPQPLALPRVPQAARPLRERLPAASAQHLAGRVPRPSRPSRPQPLPFQEARTRSRAAGAAQAVTQGGGGGGGRSGRRRREQMALKKTREPAARAHIQLASARRAAPPPSPWPRRCLATGAGGGPGPRCLVTEPSFFPQHLRLPAREGLLLAIPSPFCAGMEIPVPQRRPAPGSPWPLG